MRTAILIVVLLLQACTKSRDDAMVEAKRWASVHYGSEPGFRIDCADGCTIQGCRCYVGFPEEVEAPGIDLLCSEMGCVVLVVG